MSNKMLQVVWVLTVAMCLITSPQMGSGQAFGLELRTKYCSQVLKQSELQERDCAGAPNRFLLSRRSVIHLLCCLGALSAVKVDNDYTPYLDTSLIFYIVVQVKTVGEEEDLATFVRQCYDQPALSGRNLTEADFTNWKPNRTQCQL